MHPKGRSAFITKPFYRLSISSNEREEDLSILPDIEDEAVLAKMLVLYTDKHEMPMPSLTAKERSTFANAILAQIPSYLHYLFHALSVPDHLKDQRFEIKPYCSPKVKELLEKARRCLVWPIG